ncbi:MAG: pseudouridine synthase [Chromatiales bacterium]|nr:pseudouridine synthase [Gammaproteobacteria bacterium]MCP5351629.1 pseudouridine synthase [Chromatiales bacterium]
MSERIQKALASGGYGSRRRIEEQIKAGRISINGQICELGALVEPGDKIRIDGRLLDIDLRVQRRRRVIALHKAEGVVTSTDDPEGRPTVFDRLPQMRFGRWISVGRLDINTTGLLLLTNDGELANRLMHPSGEIEREYAVRVLGVVTDDMLQSLRSGVLLDDGMAHFEHIAAGRRNEDRDTANAWFHVSLKEGRNREVRRMWEAVGLKVSRLSRVRYGPIVLPRDLPRGRWRELEEYEVRALCEVVGLRHQEPVVESGRGRRNGQARPPRDEGRPGGRPYERSGDRGGDRSGGRAGERPGGGRPRERDDSDGWRSGGDRPARGGERGVERAGPRGPNRDGGRGEARNARPGADRSRGDRPQGDRPRGDRPLGDRPRGDRPHGDRPHGDRPRDGFRGAADGAGRGRDRDQGRGRATGRDDDRPRRPRDGDDRPRRSAPARDGAERRDARPTERRGGRDGDSRTPGGGRGRGKR